MNGNAVVLVATVALTVGCGPVAQDVLDAETAARGRDERAFWASYDEARALLAKGDTDAARRRFEDTLDLRPTHPASIYALAGIEHRAGRHAEALALCDRLLLVDLPATRAYLLRAAVESDVEFVLRSGRAPGPWFDLARADADAAAAEVSNPEETGPHVAHAKIALLRGDLGTADASLSRALTIHPGHSEALVLRAVAAGRRGALAAARESVSRALAATTPKEQTLPAGEGDTEASLALAAKLDVPRLRALAAALRFQLADWPADAPLRPKLADLGTLPSPGSEPLRVIADLDGDGSADELTARRATEADALHALFGVRDAAKGSFTLRLGGKEATTASGLAGVAACAGALVAADVDSDGRVDVVVLPGEGDPSRVEPPLLLRNLGGGKFDVSLATLSAAR